MKAPFPYFGGKSTVASLVWGLLGEDVPNYVEPFAGSLAVLLARPGGAGKTETVNDADGLLANAWRAIIADPISVARYADTPVNEADLHARHLWLVGQREALTARLMADPEWFDAKAAGWWVWGTCSWIGAGFCIVDGPWLVHDGKFTDRRTLPPEERGRGVGKQLPHLSDRGQGVNRPPGVQRKLPRLAGAGTGVTLLEGASVYAIFAELCARLRRVRVACGDFGRILGPSITHGLGTTGVFLDPPYDAGNHDPYASSGAGVAARAREWCLANWYDPRLRIVIAGYSGEHEVLERVGFRRYEWKARGGYGSQGDGRGRANASRECLWASASCNLLDETDK